MSDTTLSILDVGHGNSAVLVDNAAVIAIDAGPGSTLLEFLRQERITKINALLISHADKDHIKGIVSLLESQISIDLVCLNTDSEKDTDLWDDLTYELGCADKNGNLQFEIGLTTSDTGKFHTDQIQLEIVAPTPYLAAKGPGSTDRKNRNLTTNSLSAVIRLTKAGAPFVLLPGDIDDTGFQNLLEEGIVPSAPIAVFPHHGGKPGKDSAPVPFTKMFCESLKPEVVIFSNGRGSHGTPRKEIVQTIRGLLPNTRIACTQLSEHCAAKLPDEDFGHLTEKHAKGKEKGACCTGTIVVELGEDEIGIRPDKDNHRDFIEKAAPDSLCLSG